MKNILKISIITLASLIALSSCIKETEPNYYVTYEQVAESPAGLEAMVNGITSSLVQYSILAAGLSSDFGYPGILIALESMTGDLTISVTGYDHFGAWSRSVSIDSPDARSRIAWVYYYRWIKTANDIIGMIDEDNLTEKTKEFIGIAYGIRAKCYLDLARQYGFRDNLVRPKPSVVGLTVPIITETTTEEEAKNNPRASTEDMYTFIFSDLTKASTYLENVAVSRTKMNKFFVYGMFAEAYMERGAAGVSGAYAQAASYAKKVIDESGRTPLTSTQWHDETTGFNSVSANNSWLWALPQSSDQVTNLYSFVAHMTNEEDWTSYGRGVGRAINRTVYERIPYSDWRKFSWLDPDRKFNDTDNLVYVEYSLDGGATTERFTYNTLRPNSFYKGLKAIEPEIAVSTRAIGKYNHIKFRPKNGNWTTWKEGNAIDVVVMRIEEMMFIEAEATAYSDLGTAKTMLNTFMQTHRDATYDCSAIATLDDFIEELIFQKRIEFWGEGIIYYDLKRHGFAPQPLGYTGTNAPANYRLNFPDIHPGWNPAIPNTETQNNIGIGENNNPNPSISVTGDDKQYLWVQ